MLRALKIRIWSIQCKEHIFETENILFAQSYRLVKVVGNFITQFECEARDITLLVVKFPILETAFQHFASLRCIAILNLFEGLANLVFRLASYHSIEPIGCWLLVGRSENLHLIAILEFLTYADILIAYASTYTFTAHITMDGECKI